MNLFLSTCRLTSQREDHLTEFFAATLREDARFRQAFEHLILAPHARQKGWPLASITEILTQVSFPDEACRPNMQLTLEDGRLILCENKIDAVETVSPDHPDYDGQVDRYLDLPVDGVLYIRADWRPPASHVLAHPRYISPERREHFLWRDFYPALGASDHLLSRWLAEAFETFGYTPPHPVIGDMDDRDPERREANHRNFAKLWARTRSAARQLGWDVGRGAICQLYLTNNDEALAEQVFLHPAADSGSSLLVRVTPELGFSPSVLAERLCNLDIVAERGLQPEVVTVQRAGGSREVVDVKIGLLQLLGDAETADQLEGRLHDYVEALLRELHVVVKV